MRETWCVNLCRFIRSSLPPRKMSVYTLIGHEYIWCLGCKSAEEPVRRSSHLPPSHRERNVTIPKKLKACSWEGVIFSIMYPGGDIMPSPVQKPKTKFVYRKSYLTRAVQVSVSDIVPGKDYTRRPGKKRSRYALSFYGMIYTIVL